MATREEIREGMEKTICSNCDNVGDYEEWQTLEEAQVYCREKAICAYCTDLTSDILHKEDSQGVVREVKCPDCEWYQFADEETAAMARCHSCNSTGYLIKSLIEGGASFHSMNTNVDADISLIN